MDYALSAALIAYTAWNIVVFFIYFADKLRAKKNAYRISEKTLILCAFFMGAAGALSAMYLIRHKTRHTKFKLLVPLALVLNFLAIYAVFSSLPVTLIHDAAISMGEHSSPAILTRPIASYIIL